MRRLHIIVLCVIFVVSAAAFLPAEPISLAVTQIVPIGVDKDTARLVEELLQTEFSKSPVFQLVERSRLDEILEEQKLSLSGITNAETAVEAGYILNVDRVVFGSIGRYESDYIDYLLSLRLVDVERATVEAADSIQIRKGAELQKTISQIVYRLQSKLSFTGTITAFEGNSVYTSLNEGMGIGPADVLGVFKTDLIKDETGAVIMREETSVANLVVEQVSPEGSKCKILDSAGKLSKGLLVKKGRIALQETGTGGSLAVETIPEGAKVFLGREFIGETPLQLEGLEPDRYSVEIRTGGYKTYKDNINVSAGKTSKLEIELEQDIPTEELLLLGKIPRQKTDPGTAMKKALLPGAGYIYNGYDSAGLILPAGIVLNLTFGGLMSAEYVEARNYVTNTAEPSSSTGYWESREYYNNVLDTKNNLVRMAVFGGSALYSYLFSILDAGMSAKSDFLYPTYVELAVGGTGLYTRMSQTRDSNVTLNSGFEDAVAGGTSALDVGGYMDIVFRGRKLYAGLGLTFSLGPIVLDYRGAYRFQIGDSVLIGPGFSIHANFQKPRDVEFDAEGPDALNPMIGDFFAPVLSFSYLGYFFEMDLNIAPVAVGSVNVFFLQSGSDWTGNTSAAGIFASMAEVAFNWFFSMHTGIRLQARYYYGWERENILAEKGFTTVDSFHYFTGSAGLVFRF